MKLAFFSLSLILAFANLAEAKTVTVQGDAARSIMEALYAAGFPVSHIDDEEYGTHPMTVEVTDLMCGYSVVDVPDEWMSRVRCYVVNEGMERPNALALATALAPFVDFDAGLGSRYLSVDKVQCVLNYNERFYSCQLDAQFAH